MQRIPATNDADQIFTVTLGGQVVRLRLSWQDIGESWFLSLFDAVESPILLNSRIKNRTLVISFRLLEFVGDFAAVSVDVNAPDLGREAWGNTHNLFYLTAPEKVEVQSARV